MIKEALQFLQGSWAAKEVQNGDNHKTTLVLPDGSLKEVAHPPKPRSHTFRDLGDFCAALARYSKADQTVFVSLTRAVCVLCDVQDVHRENVLTLELSPTSVFAALEALGKPLDQKDLIHLLRTTFGTCEWSDDLLNAVETVRFTRTDDGESTVSTKGDSLGKGVKAAVSGLKGPLPPKVTCSFPAFPLINNESVRDVVNVELAFFVDHIEAEFTLVPLAHSVDEARLMAVEAIQSAIATKAKVPVYIGSP